MTAATASAVKKKTCGAKKTKSASSHPPFLDMISSAILSLKERTGSSQYAIAKFIEEKFKQLPSNFRKLLLVQLKKFVVSGKLVKVKASYKLPPASAAVKKSATAKPKDASSGTVKPNPKTVKSVTKPKPKTKVATPVKAKAKVAAKPKTKAVTKPTKAAKTSTPTKKVKPPTKKKAVVAKKPKSLKSPAKKSSKKAKK